MATDKGLLAGVSIVGLDESVSASYCTKLLAELGAEVIKIEKPGVGDDTRREPPFFKDFIHPERSLLFHFLNAGKLGITLDLSRARGKNLFQQVIKHADVLVCSYPPRVAEKLEISHESLKSVNPQLIMVSVTPFGQTGPYRNYKSNALTTGHASGDGFLNAGAERDVSRAPVKVGGHYYDFVAGVNAAVGLLFALLGRQSTGVSQHVDISQQEAIMALVRYELTAYPNEGTVATRSTRAYRVGGILPCKDGYVQITIHQDYQWDSLIKFLGEPGWSKEEKYRDWRHCLEHYTEINALIAEEFKKHTKEELYHGGQKANCPIAPFLTPAENLRSEQIEERNFLVEVEHPCTEKILYPSLPFKLSDGNIGERRPAPLLGQHNEEVYCNRMKYAKDDLLRLAEAGVI